MPEPSKMAKNMERIAQSVAAHDRENPDHSPAYGIAMNHFDLERLGFEEGEEIIPGITVHIDAGVTGNFRVLCDTTDPREEAARHAANAVSEHKLPVPVPSHGGYPG